MVSSLTLLFFLCAYIQDVFLLGALEQQKKNEHV